MQESINLCQVLTYDFTPKILSRRHASRIRRPPTLRRPECADRLGVRTCGLNRRRRPIADSPRPPLVQELLVPRRPPLRDHGCGQLRAAARDDRTRRRNTRRDDRRRDGTPLGRDLGRRQSPPVHTGRGTGTRDPAAGLPRHERDLRRTRLRRPLHHQRTIRPRRRTTPPRTPCRSMLRLQARGAGNRSKSVRRIASATVHKSPAKTRVAETRNTDFRQGQRTLKRTTLSVPRFHST